MAQQSALIIGASRGLGLGLAQEYLRRGWQVTGTVRAGKPAKLHAVDHPALRIEDLDITEAGQIVALRDRLQGQRFDLLFVNAGVTNNMSDPVGQVTDAEFMRVMLTNALGAMRAVETLATLVSPNGTIAAMSSGLGSVADNNGGGWEVYRASKAALNTLMRSYAARTGGDHSLILVAPGWVRTDMGGPQAGLDVETSCRGVADVIAAQAGKPGLQYLDYRGQTVRW